MAGTRSQSRANDSPQSSKTASSPNTGDKRKNDSVKSSPQQKKKQQKTLEETIPDRDMEEAAEDVEQEQASKSKAPAQDSEKSNGHAEKNGEHEEKPDEQNGHAENESKADNANEKSKDEPREGNAIKVDPSRSEAEPSNILEKGIIYFFARGRVGTTTPESVQEIARSYIVLRPLPSGATLKEGEPLPETSNNRLLALPKKVLPRSHRDAFMTFVEKSGAKIQELKDEFMKGSEYSTKTTGTSHTPPVTPIGEGVYAITSTGQRSSHLAYMLTLPEKLGEVHEDMGLKDKGSFVLSTKNPEFSGPSGTNLPRGPDFPKEILEEFRGLRWFALAPKHLEYANTQFLLIGEGQGELGGAVEQTAKDAKHEKESPEEEIEKLMGEEYKRVEALQGDDTVFVDLGISKDEYPKLKSSW